MEKKKKPLSNLINNLKNKTMETNEIELIVNELDNDFTEVLTQMETEDDNK